MAAEHEPVIRVGRVPVRQGARDDIAHPLALAGVEKPVLGQFQRQQVARVFAVSASQRDVAPAKSPATQTAAAARCAASRFRRAARSGGLRRRFERAAGARHHRALAEQHHEIAA